MTAMRRIFTNTLLLVGSELARIAFYLGLTIIIARHLGSTELGKFAYMTSLVGILSTFIDLGLSAFYVREAQHPEGQAVLGAIIWIRSLAGLVVSAALASYALSVSDRSLRVLLFLGSLLLLLGVIPGTVIAVLRAQEKMIYESWTKVGSSVLTAVGGILVVLSGGGIANVAAVMTVVAAAMLIYFVWLGHQHFPRPFQLRASRAVFAKVARGAWPFASLSLLVMIYFRVDSLMLFALRGQEALGQYSAAYRVLETGLLLPWMISASALPPIARYLQVRTSDVIRASLTTMQFVLMLGVPAAVFGSIFASRLFTLLYGPAFGEAGQIFQVLAFALVAVYAASVTSTLISASARPSVNTAIALLMVILNVGLNLVVIPRWGGMGAAAATVVTEWTGLLSGTVYILRFIGPLHYLRFWLRPIAAAVAAGVIGLVVPSLIALPICVVIYAAILWVSGGVTRGDLAFLRALVRPPKQPASVRGGS
jgi:O-antigen/teichoic acid export membrane protein